jgi:hypothetical protein
VEKTVDYMIEHARALLQHDRSSYQRLVHSLLLMSEGGDGGQPEPWALTTVRKEYYPGWTDEDFGWVLAALQEPLNPPPDGID